MVLDLSDLLQTYIRYDGRQVGTELSFRSPPPPLDRFAREHFALDVDMVRGHARLVLKRPLDREECGGNGVSAHEFCELSFTVDCFRVLFGLQERHMGGSVMLPSGGTHLIVLSDNESVLVRLINAFTVYYGFMQIGRLMQCFRFTSLWPT